MTARYKKKFDELRQCRVDGARPTVRERWVAFHRLWRIAQGQGAYTDMAAIDCFRILFQNWASIRLMEAEEKSPSRVHAPPFLRKMLLDYDRRKRLGFPDKEHCQRLAHYVREQSGIEVTPDQVAEVRMKLLRSVRDKALADGIPIPRTDAALWEWLCQGWREAKITGQED